MTSQPPRISELSLSARRWAASDIDADDARQLNNAVESGDEAELISAMSRPLAFGTAGLRSTVGPGSSRLNLATVSQAIWALSLFLQDTAVDSPRIVVGYDARPDSERFARQACRIIEGMGGQALFFPEMVPTPLVAFAVRHLRADAGCVVTASHNPRGDNGLKVFDNHGVQIVSPWDREIAERMARAPAAKEMPVAGGSSNIDESVLAAYFAQLRDTVASFLPTEPSRPLQIAYTPLHGVGLSWVQQALRACDLSPVVPVRSQALPDGSFPTLEFPNPEEAGALDELLLLAKNEECEGAIANDPDADRCALCLPDSGGGMIRLSGDALGLLLADVALSATDEGGVKTIVSTVVSSPALEELASARGARLLRTLTGFKWICRAALEAERFVFAFEEAIGYCFASPSPHPGVMDKDGVLTAALLSKLVHAEGGGGRLRERLNRLYREFGYWGSYSASRRVSGMDLGPIERRMAAVRAGDFSLPPGVRILRRVDYTQGQQERPGYLGTTNLLQFDFEVREQGNIEKGRFLLRPSGTEPKLKAYIHLRTPLSGDEELLHVHRRQEELAVDISREVLKL